jgi:hypothetical protein
MTNERDSNPAPQPPPGEGPPAAAAAASPPPPVFDARELGNQVLSVGLEFDRLQKHWASMLANLCDMEGLVVTNGGVAESGLTVLAAHLELMARTARGLSNLLWARSPRPATNGQTEQG